MQTERSRVLRAALGSVGRAGDRTWLDRDDATGRTTAHSYSSLLGTALAAARHRMVQGHMRRLPLPLFRLRARERRGPAYVVHEESDRSSLERLPRLSRDGPLACTGDAHAEGARRGSRSKRRLYVVGVGEVLDEEAGRAGVAGACERPIAREAWESLKARSI